MTLKARVNALGWTIAVLGASGILTVNDFYTHLGLKPLFGVLGYYWCYLLIFCAVIQLIIILYKLIRQNVRVIEFLNRNNFFVATICEDNDINYIIKNSSEASVHETDDNETLWIYEQDPESFTIIKDKREKKRGYYCVIRLTPAGVRAIEENKFSMKTLSSVFIEKKKQNYVPIYIGGVYGEANSGVLNTYLLAELNGYVKSHKNREVYARAESNMGLYWLKDYGFKPVNPLNVGLGHVYVLKPRHKKI